MHRFVTAAAIAAVLAAAAFTPGIAGAAPTPYPSCIDVDNNGRCNGADPDLAPLLEDGSGFVDTTEYTSRIAGIVLADHTASADGLYLYATGDVHLQGSVKATSGGGITVETERDIVIAPGATISAGGPRCCVAGLSLYGRSLTVGDTARVKVSGSETFSDVYVETLTIGDGVAATVSGRDTELDLYATNRLTVGRGLRVKLASTGVFALVANTDVTLDGASIQAGTIDIEALPPDEATRPVTRVLSLLASRVNQTSVDGGLTLHAGYAGDHAPGDTVRLTGTLARTRGAIDVDPR